MIRPVDAPACFSAASVFSHDSQVCRACPAFDACAAASLETLEAIKDIVNVQDLLKRHQKARGVAMKAIEQADQERLATQPPGNVTPPLPSKPVERKTQVVSVKFDLSDDHQQIIAVLPVKPQKIAISLCKAGLIERIKKDLQEGRNTFAMQGPGFLRVALSLLISGGFSKKGLREALVKELEWGDGTASSHVGIACALLTAFGIAQETEGRLALPPASGA